MSEHDEFVENQDLPEPEEVEEEAVRPAVEPADAPDLVDLNTATVDDLRQLPGIGQALAARIVNYRVEVQPFQEPAELTAVPGVSDGVYERIAASLTVSPVDVVDAEIEAEDGTRTRDRSRGRGRKRNQGSNPRQKPRG